MPHVQRPLLALGLRVIGMALIATMFMLVKLLGQRGVALPELMFWRQFVTLPLLGGWLAITANLGSLKTRRIKSHAGRAVMGMTGMMCGFGASILLPLAESTTLSFTTPLFAVILTALVLRETVGPWRWLAVVVGFAGVLVIAQPGHAPIDPLGAAAGLGAGLLVAVISFQIRDLSRTEPPLSIVFYFALFGALMTAPFLPFTMTAHDGSQWLLLLLIGVVGTVGQIFLTTALRNGAVASVIVMDYSALIWATLYDWAIWDQLPPFTTWLGAPLIIAAGLTIGWREHKLAKAITPPSAIEAE